MLLIQDCVSALVPVLLILCNILMTYNTTEIAAAMHVPQPTVPRTLFDAEVLCDAVEYYFHSGRETVAVKTTHRRVYHQTALQIKHHTYSSIEEYMNPARDNE